MNKIYRKMIGGFTAIMLIFSVFLFTGEIKAATNPTYYEQFSNAHTAEIVATELGQSPNDEISDSNLNITGLTLSNKGLTDVNGIGIFSKISTLSLSGNELIELPADITMLSMLRNLDVGQNKLEFLPENIGDLNQLLFLSLYGNELTTLPDSISQMGELVSLGINQNKITTLPDTIGNLKKLQYLYADNNELTKLPDGISELTLLRLIDFSHNKLEALPVNIGNLNNTTTFNFSHNLLTSIPESVGFLTTTDNVRFGYNQLISVPESMKIFMNQGGYFFVENQEYQAQLESGFITKNYEFETLPIFNNIKSFHTGIQVNYQLIKPDLSQVDITADIENQLISKPEKLIINKNNFNQLGSYKVVANVSNTEFWILFSNSTYQLNFDINGAIPIDLELNGAAEQSLFVGEEYVEQGATASDLNGDVAVTVSGDVNTAEAGLYTLTYTATNQYESVQLERKVEVKEADPINLELHGSEELTMYVGDTYKELGAVATDLNGDLEVHISGTVDTSKVGDYTLTYEASNDYETKEVSRVIHVVSKPDTNIKDSAKNNPESTSNHSIKTGQTFNAGGFIMLGIVALMIVVGLKVHNKD